jgi:hypothetical protein
LTIDALKGVRGEGEFETAPPRQFLEKLVNKNAIKPKISEPPLAIFSETLDPDLGIFAKTSSTPRPPPWILNPCASMFLTVKVSISTYFMFYLSKTVDGAFNFITLGTGWN